MIIFIAGVFSGHILVKKIILSELYCCNMIIFCKLLKIKMYRPRCAEVRFLLVKLCDLWPKAALHYESFEGKKR